MSDLETLEKKLEARCQDVQRKIKTKSGALVFSPTKELQDEISALAGRIAGLKEALEMVTNLRHDNPMSFEKPPEDCL